MTKNRKNYLVGIWATLSAYWSSRALAAEASDPGLPQLDVTTWPSQLFWLVLLFGLGYLVMAKLVTPRIGAVLEERRNKLNGDIEKARVASADAARIRADYESDLQRARNEATEYIKESSAKASKKVDAAEVKAAKKLADKVTKAEAKLGKAKTNAMENLNEVAAEAAVEAVFVVAGIKTTSAHASKAAASISATLAKQEAN